MENLKTGLTCDSRYTKEHVSGFSRKYKKLRRNSRLKDRVDEAIEKILDDPFKAGNKTKDKRLLGSFVYRLGDYRICYFIDSNEYIVRFFDIWNRSEAYKPKK